MSSSGHTVEVTNLSPAASEKDVNDFFAFCGPIQQVEIIRHGDLGCTAYVTFKDPYSLETALFLNGACLLEQPVCVTRWGHQQDNQYDFWNANQYQDYSSSSAPTSQYGPSPGEAVAMAQNAVKTVLTTGYTLGKTAATMAQEYNQSYQLTATATAKVSELTERIGLADKLFAGMEAAKSVDQKYHVTETTKQAVSTASKTAVNAASSVVNSSYFSKGALWMSDALNRAAKAAADVANQPSRT
ncbi:hypothetical protein QQ045_020866 [Rhodiola kirilowii]